MELPQFRYHPDPIRSGSIVESDKKCKCCRKARGYIYTGPVYAERDLDESLCPWCIADGSAAEKYEALFIDDACFDDDMPAEAVDEISQRTPGYNAWQGEQWPVCCGDATQFIMPAGLKEVREYDYTLEGTIMTHIVQEMGISGGAAVRLLESLNRDKGPTVFLFKCEKCLRPHLFVDRP